MGGRTIFGGSRDFIWGSTRKVWGVAYFFRGLTPHFREVGPPNCRGLTRQICQVGFAISDCQVGCDIYGCQVSFDGISFKTNVHVLWASRAKFGGGVDPPDLPGRFRHFFRGEPLGAIFL